MRTHTIATAAALLLALTACSNGDDDSPKDDKPTSRAAATPQDTPAPTPTPAPAAPMEIGQTLTFTDDVDGVTMAVTVLGYEQDTFKPQTSADEEFGTTGYTWAAVEIKACVVSGGNSGVTRYPWALAYADGARIEPSGTTYGDFPKPEYPHEAALKNGECVRGKTVFAVPAKQRPERVLYTPESMEIPAEWAVPKA
ncbi:hypothetical protein GCM10010330_16200 [Streptomyces tendae]|uniref:hypothetical protein n=1 Tax=Streptomyces tendae TaxID=1932 RepID=UPI0016736E25|nr:hypothetical protein [Streptomyces tendae]GHA64143.1 hypothetical protein GCM10010330_16200 [Streptomyces tendae]